jgi:hypothetical protein
MNAPASEFCARSAELPALLSGELSSSEASNLRAHVSTCVDCREDFVLLQRMRAEEGASTELGVNMESRLRAHLPSGSFRPAPAEGRSGLLVGVVGTVILVSLLAVLLPRIPMDKPDSSALRTQVLERLTAELVAAQRPDGSIVSPGAEDLRYATGITGLAVRSLLAGRSEGKAREASQRGLEFLLRQQGADGLFGPPMTDALYNHAPALLALLEAQRRGPDARMIGPIRKGLSALVARQKADGGFGYSDKEEGNVVISAWPLEVLKEARAGGQAGMESSIQRVKQFIMACAGEGTLRYSTFAQSSGGTPVLSALSAWYSRELTLVSIEPTLADASEAMALGFHTLAGTKGAMQRILDSAAIPEARCFQPSWAVTTRDPVAAAAMTAWALVRAPNP